MRTMEQATKTEKCNLCKGSGQLTIEADDSAEDDYRTEVVECEDCDGAGRVAPITEAERAEHAEAERIRVAARNADHLARNHGGVCGKTRCIWGLTPPGR